MCRCDTLHFARLTCGNREVILEVPADKNQKSENQLFAVILPIIRSDSPICDCGRGRGIDAGSQRWQGR